MSDDRARVRGKLMLARFDRGRVLAVGPSVCSVPWLVLKQDNDNGDTFVITDAKPA